jgi:hypothetical protein
VNQGGADRGRQEGEGRRHRRQPPPLPVQHPSEIELSPMRERERLWLWLWVAMLVCWGRKWAERHEREGGSGLFNWRDGLGDRRGWSWRSVWVLAKLGGGI